MKPIYHRVFILLSWLVFSPCLCHPILGRNHTNNIQCIDTERDVLLQFKRGVTNDTCGMLTSWQPHTDCCQWDRVVCSNLIGHVIMLNLGGDDYKECLEGKVSPSLGELTHLKHLNLSTNNFYGEIPPQLGNLSKLTTLDLRISYNSKQSRLSWITRLSLLRYLDLSAVDLSKVTNWMTIVSNLRSLTVLRMELCGLPSKIPSSLSYVNSSTTLHTISLIDNNFNDSSIFQWLFNFPGITTQLVYLDLSWTVSQIPLPTEFENFRNLSHLSLVGNGFRGSVLKIISKLCNLKYLALSYNNFTDELSNVIHSLVDCNNNSLETLDLGWNRFWGTIPNSISSLSSLRGLLLDGNQLKGEINQAIGQLLMLEVLDLSYNYFEHALTHSLFLNLVNLRELDLSNPGLVINIDDNWIPPFQLDAILLRSCKLGPRFPKWLQSQTNISVFDVSNTGISDTIPVSFWKSLSSNLAYLNMSYNQFYGMIPDLLHVSTWLDLSSNLFEGVVPSGFANVGYLYLNDNKFVDCSRLCPKITYLERLDLSNNLFSGELPDCWMNFTDLMSLHLENNNFSGHIPDFISAFSSLIYVHLNNNSFSGPFPIAFKNHPSLTILNLGYNSLSGHIPPWIGNSSRVLGALILRKNMFRGEIPESICQLNQLQILDLALNQISGVIPSCIGNFTSMKWNNNLISFGQVPEFVDNSRHFWIKTETVFVSWKREVERYKETIKFVKNMDLSSNELSGEIPEVISSLNGLQSLDLSKNKLDGNIPLQIGNLTALEFLVLSDNHLTGEIPVSLAQVTTLGILDVSNNNLSGKIPVSTQLQSFNASSYAGNRLCGEPLPSCSKDRVSPNVPNGDDETNVKDKDDDFGFFLGLFISVALGFIFGFWGVCGTLIIKTSWRHAYFRFLDNIKDRVF